MAIKNKPFDDSYVKSRRRNTVDQYTTTAGFDAHRQGVELTLPRHYALGMVTVHGGYGGQDGDHTIPQMVYGQSQKILLDERYHRDIVPAMLENYFDRDVAINNGVIDRGTDLDVDPWIFDGVMEPFDIRAVVALKPTSERYGRKLWAALGEGNVADRRGSDVFVSIVKNTDLNTGTFAMVDSSNHVGGILTTAESLTIDDRRHAPFNENYDKRGVATSSNMENDMTTALTDMAPDTVNMVPIGYTQRGGSGFDY